VNAVIVGRHLVEVGKLLKLLLDRIGDLCLHLGGRRPWPHRGDDHELDGKRGIFRASQASIGKQACHAEHDDQEEYQRRMRNGPS
jgi:hypothetical protein